MAEDDSSQEKTEEATPKRLEKAKEEGQTPRSRELSTTAVLLVGAIALYAFGGYLVDKLENILSYNFSLSREQAFDPQLMFSHLGHSFYEALIGLIPIFVLLTVAAIVGPIAIGGLLFSPKALQPKLSRMSLIKGLQRMFSMKALMELAKAIGKVLVILFVAYFLLQATKHDLLGLASEGIERGIEHSIELSVLATIVLSASTLIIAMVDIPFQIWDHAKNLKMSRQDIKDEMKDTEGKPEVKGKIRQLQQEMVQKRMMASVPDADVVITNPTHYSIALKYKPEQMQTPILLAKGVDHVAMKIREIARVNQIEFVEAPALARAIYYSTEIDQEIPEGLYLAVAQVLAYVFQLREFRKGNGERPNYPRNLEIPPNMQR